jgi:hypothetical protein
MYQYGSYTYSKCVIEEHPEEIVARLRTAETPGRDGGMTQGGVLGMRRVTLSGILIPLPADDLEALWDAFKAAHAPGLPRQLVVGVADRYVLAEVESAHDVNAANYPSSRPFEVTFLVANPPLWLASTADTTPLGTTGDDVILGGTAPVPPQISVVMDSFPLASTLVLTNTETGEALALEGDGATLEFLIDCDTKQITDPGGADRTGLWSAGRFWRLAPGTSTLTVSAAGGAVVDSVEITVRERWY